MLPTDRPTPTDTDRHRPTPTDKLKIDYLLDDYLRTHRQGGPGLAEESTVSFLAGYSKCPTGTFLLSG